MRRAYRALPRSLGAEFRGPPSGSLKTRVSKRPPEHIESKEATNIFTRRVLCKIPETHCSAGIFTEINGRIDPAYRFTLTKDMEKFVYDIRELVPYIESKKSEPEWMGTDWQKPPVEITGKDLSVLMEAYNKEIDDDDEKINLVPLMDRLNRMKPRVAEKPVLGKALVNLKEMMTPSYDTTIGEEAFRVQEAFEYIDGLSERMQALVLHLKDPKTGNTLKGVKKKVDLAKNSEAGGSDICKKELLDPMKRIFDTYSAKYQPSGMSLGIVEEEDES